MGTSPWLPFLVMNALTETAHCEAVKPWREFFSRRKVGRAGEEK